MPVSVSSLAAEDANIVQWAFSGQYDSNVPVLIDAEEPTRYITKEKAIQLTANLTGAFEENTTVCLNIPNDIVYPILCYAIWASKCRWTGVNPGYQSVDLTHHFRTSETKYVITCEEQLEKIREAVRDCGREVEIILYSDLLKPQPAGEQTACGVHHGHCHRNQSSEFRYLHELQKTKTPESLFEALSQVDNTSIAALASTSGTTGLPKMAARTHKSHVLEAAAAQDNHAAKPYPVRRLFCTPIFHSFSTGEMAINSMRLGQPTYFIKRFDPKIFPQAILDFQITETFAPPPLIMRLVDNPDAHAQIQSLRNIYCGGAPLVPELKNRLDAIYLNNPHGPPRIAQVWGMTEGGWFTTFKYGENDSTNSVGRPIPGYEIRIVPRPDFHTTTTTDGEDNLPETGELYIRGPNLLMTCYFNNPEATADAFEDDGTTQGWLKTGDVGYISPQDGKVYLIDRCKDLIKVNGFQVSPTELENALLTLPGIADAGVVGALSGTTGEHPVAFVVRQVVHDDDDEEEEEKKGSGEDGLITKEQVKARLRRQLASYKVSMMEVVFLDALPKSITGKILRGKLRELC